jgi:hypothetical protein
MLDTNETHDEQLLRVLKEMVLSGELIAEERDGELYFTLANQSAE